MPPDLLVSDLRYTPAPPSEQATGLLGYASFLLNGRVRIDGVTVRRQLSGELSLSWPSRTDRSGRRHPLIRPLDDTTRRELESQVFGILGLPDHAGDRR